jgi:hypothetical protein
VSVALPATPAFICCAGMRAVEYRIFVACRNATVCVAVKRACCTANNGSQTQTKISFARA